MLRQWELYVDHKRDCFELHFQGPQYRNIAVEKMRKISGYVINMEILYVTGFQPYPEHIDWERLHSKWQARLHQLLNVLELTSVESIADYIRQEITKVDRPWRKAGFKTNNGGETLALAGDKVLQRFLQGTKHAEVLERVRVLDLGGKDERSSSKQRSSRPMPVRIIS